MPKDKKDNFLVPKSLVGMALSVLSDNQAGLLFRRIYKFEIGEDESSKDVMVEQLFSCIKPVLLEFISNYDKQCEIKRLNGSKGGRPKKNVEVNEKPTGFENNQTKHDSDSDNDVSNETIIIEEISKEETKPQTEKKKTTTHHHAEYDWIAPSFHDCFEEFLNYKRSDKKGTYKSENSVHKAYNQLIELSNNDPMTAQKIVDQTIANGYQGLFPLKNNNSNGTSISNPYQRRLAAERELGEALARRSAEEFAAEARGAAEGQFVPPPL